MRCGRILTGRLAEPTWLKGRFRHHSWTSSTAAVRSAPMIIGPIRALYFFTSNTTRLNSSFENARKEVVL
jgi:hypothetical protein